MICTCVIRVNTDARWDDGGRDPTVDDTIHIQADGGMACRCGAGLVCADGVDGGGW